MTIQEACRRLGKSESTVRRLIRQGRLTATKTGRVWDIPEAAVLDLSSDQSDDQSPPAHDQSAGIMIQQLREENEYLKDRIAELEGARERSDTIILQLTRQLDQSQRLLEYHESPWWRRWFKRGKADQE